jgi:penicillin-binding protein 1B
MEQTRQTLKRLSQNISSAFKRLDSSVRDLRVLDRIRTRFPAGPSRNRLLAVLAVVVALAGIGFLSYCLHLSAEIENRFSARRWSIPSKVFSDTTILYPGQRINPELFKEKLQHLGYRRVLHRPEQKGEMRAGESVIEIFLRDLDLGYRSREGFPIRILLRRNRIQSIIHKDSGESMPILELEPEEIALLFGPERERRQLVSITQVPQHLTHAVLSAEDKRFFRHHGFDPMGILRAFYANLRHGAIVQGGSTITQQLAKCFFLHPKKTFSRKLKEFLMSIIMEMKYEKNEILEIYLNEIYLGQKGSVSINGVGEASSFYFAKTVNELSIAEAACIAGLVRAPNKYSPYIDNERCLERRNSILTAMYKNGHISEDELNAERASQVSPAGATDFSRKAPYFSDYLSEQLTAVYPPEALTSLGLSIFTTLDTQVQMAAEGALERGLSRLEQSNPTLLRPEKGKSLQGAIIVIQPKTGYILAMVGGRDYTITQFNRISQARRQPGSAFKPFVYLSGLDEFTPASRLSTTPKSYTLDGKQWEPRNFKPVPGYDISMRQALAKSINLATVDLAMQLGMDRIVDTTTSFHFSTPVKSYPSLSLGAFEVIPIEMARAYCAFAADGVLPYALSIRAVVDEDGETLERRHMSIERVTTPAQAFVMTSLLRSVVTEGTARPLKRSGISFPVAGKTGTTNNFRDAWFVGYTPNILALVWVGFDNEDSIHATGSTAALPIWADLINSVPQYISDDWFRMPPGVEKRKLCSQTGKIATWRCPESIQDYVLTGRGPLQRCPLHQRENGLKGLIGG